jgi:hypothetical protein
MVPENQGRLVKEIFKELPTSNGSGPVIVFCCGVEDGGIVNAGSSTVPDRIGPLAAGMLGPRVLGTVDEIGFLPRPLIASTIAGTATDLLALFTLGDKFLPGPPIVGIGEIPGVEVKVEVVDGN